MQDHVIFSLPADTIGLSGNHAHLHTKGHVQKCK